MDGPLESSEEDTICCHRGFRINPLGPQRLCTGIDNVFPDSSESSEVAFGFHGVTSIVAASASAVVAAAAAAAAAAVRSTFVNVACQASF